MPRNGSGTYTLPKPAFVPNTTISSADVNSDFSDIATALTGSVAADGQTPITAPIKFASGTVLLPGIAFSAEASSGIYLISSGVVGITCDGTGAVTLDTSRIGSGQDGAILTYTNGAVLVPVGKVSDFAGSSAPDGWLLCYGQAISRTGYPELFHIIGTTYGSGDGTTTYNLPDLRGRVVYGKDNMGGSAANRITTAGGGIDGLTLGASGGAQSFTLSTTNFPPYTPAGTNSTSSVSFNSANNTFGALFWNNSGSATLSVPGGGSNLQAQIITGTAAAQTFTGTAQGGTSTPKASLVPGMIMNKIIFVGRV